MTDKTHIPLRIVLPVNDRAESVTMLQLLLKVGVEVYYQCKEGYCNSCSCDRPKGGAVKSIEGSIDYGIVDADEMLTCVSIIDKDKMELDPQGNYQLLFNVPVEKMKPTLRKLVESEDMAGKEIVHDFVSRTVSIKAVADPSYDLAKYLTRIAKPQVEAQVIEVKSPSKK
jgi:ferredoxin